MKGKENEYFVFKKRYVFYKFIKTFPTLKLNIFNYLLLKDYNIISGTLVGYLLSMWVIDNDNRIIKFIIKHQRLQLFSYTAQRKLKANRKESDLSNQIACIVIKIYLNMHMHFCLSNIWNTAWSTNNIYYMYDIILQIRK